MDEQVQEDLRQQLKEAILAPRPQLQTLKDLIALIVKWFGENAPHGILHNDIEVEVIDKSDALDQHPRIDIAVYPYGKP